MAGLRRGGRSWGGRTAGMALLVLVLGCSVGAIPLGMFQNKGKAAGSASKEAGGGGEGAAPDKPEKREHLRPQHGDDFPDEDFQTFGEYDKNGDGAVDLNEWLGRLGGTPAKPEHHLFEVSGGKAGEERGDAKLGEEERQRWTEEFQKYDRDHDGKLSWDDWAFMMYHEIPQHPKFHDGFDDYPYDFMDYEKLEEQFTTHDVNKDEHLDTQEMLAFVREEHKDYVEGRLDEDDPEKLAEQRRVLQEEWEEEAKSYSAALMENLDQNEDGKLSLDEWKMYFMDY